MKRCLAALAVAFAFTVSARADEPAVAHMVFFQLKDNSPENQKKLVDACKKYLKKHDGVLYFSAGTRAAKIEEPVSAKDFDVALHIVFKNKAALDKYGPHPDHQKFIAENKDNWKGVKVYDSLLEVEAK
jgi:hypothetical protein